MLPARRSLYRRGHVKLASCMPSALTWGLAYSRQEYVTWTGGETRWEEFLWLPCCSTKSTLAKQASFCIISLLGPTGKLAQPPLGSLGAYLVLLGTFFSGLSLQVGAGELPRPPRDWFASSSDRYHLVIPSLFFARPAGAPAPDHST